MSYEIYMGNSELFEQVFLCFLRSEYTTIVYHNLLKKFPDGCRNKDMNGITGIGSARLGNIFSNMYERGFVEREETKGGTYTYKHKRLDDSHLMDIMETSDTPAEAYERIELIYGYIMDSVTQT